MNLLGFRDKSSIKIGLSSVFMDIINDFSPFFENLDINHFARKIYFVLRVLLL